MCIKIKFVMTKCVHMYLEMCNYNKKVMIDSCKSLEAPYRGYMGSAQIINKLHFLQILSLKFYIS